MRGFTVDFAQLSDNLNHKTYKLSEVAHRIQKVAFDIVRFTDGPVDELWEIQSADDGSYIVAKYDTSEAPITASNTSSTKTATASASASASPWSSVLNRNSINIFYKDYPIARFAASDLNCTTQDLATYNKILPSKLASDQAYVSALLSSLTPETKKQLIKLYPELG